MHTGRRRTDLRAKSDGRIVFVGHGRNEVWRVLKDFLEDRLALEVEEFNRVSVAGRTTVDRLTEMLETAAFALLVMTGEDEAESGDMQPRMNVVHELGLFQVASGVPSRDNPVRRRMYGVQ